MILTIVDIDYHYRDRYKKAVSVHNHMSFDAVDFLIAINPIQ
jgi:hypothetical protein